MLSFMFNYRNDDLHLDNHALPTRRHDGKIFKEIHIVHPKAKQDPWYRAIMAWNDLPVPIRNLDVKEQFKKLLISNLVNPYKTIT